LTIFDMTNMVMSKMQNVAKKNNTLSEFKTKFSYQ